MITDLTGGSVFKLLLAFSLPLFASNALQAVYNIVDMVVVGQFVGGAGMSAVSIGGDVLHILTFLGTGFASAGQVIIAQNVGARQLDNVSKTIGTLFTSMLSASIVISVVCFVLRSGILNLLNTPVESYEYTMSYMVTCIAGLIFIYGYNIVSAILRGMGDGKRPFVFIAIAAILNIILDLLFVAVFRMAAFGAALATVIAQGISFLLSIFYLYRNRSAFGFDFRPASFRIDGVMFRKLVSLGVPMAIQSAAISASKLVLTAWINVYGVTYSALAGIYSKFNLIFSVISNSFVTAGSSMIGQNLGAGKYERVSKIFGMVFLCSLVPALVFILALVIFGTDLFRIFTSEAEVITAGAVLIAPIILNIFGGATRSSAFALINGSGNSKLNLAVALIDGVISRIGLAALLGFAAGLGCRGFWFGDSVAGFVPIIIGLIYFFCGGWKKPPETAGEND